MIYFYAHKLLWIVYVFWSSKSDLNSSNGNKLYTTEVIEYVLYHYFDKKTGPFMNLSELSMEQANIILNKIKEEKPTHRVHSVMQNICLEDICMKIS